VNIREATTSEELNEDVRNLMIQFWESYDKLFDEMDNLSEFEFHKRQNEMWEFRNKASEIKGDIFLISLWGMSEKAEKLYGSGSSLRYLNKLNYGNKNL